jgi:hypothetical protein
LGVKADGRTGLRERAGNHLSFIDENLCARLNSGSGPTVNAGVTDAPLRFGYNHSFNTGNIFAPDRGDVV